MNDALQKYATTLILEQARLVDYNTIFRAATQYLGRELSTDEAKAVMRFIRTATITVTPPSVLADATSGGAG